MNIVKFESKMEESHTERTVLDPRDVRAMLDRENMDREIVGEISYMPAHIIGGVKTTEKVTRGELREAFDLVCDASNWKNPIDIRIPNPGPKGLAMIAEAVSFFAGCSAHFRPHNDTVHVTAKGYYLSIGA